MKYRQLGTTALNVSEVGFGVWTVATNWWGKIEEDEGIGLLVKAFDLGVNFFDTADTYGNGYGEEILAKALKKQRHDIVIGTKFGYDFYTSAEREGHKERPQKWTPGFVRYACEQSLRRLQTDYIDLYQLHNPKMDAIESDELFDTLEELVKEGKIRCYGAAIGPDIGWYDEGMASMEERDIRAMQIIYSILEQQPARDWFSTAEKHKTGLITRVPHASGMLDGTYTKDTVFEASDHRSHRRQQWLETSLKKIEQLDFLTDSLSSTIGQIAIKFALSGPMVATVLPNITNLPQLEEFAAASETEDIPQEFVQRLHELYDENFLVGEGTREQPVAD
ncbi:MAG: aldo/keto reductase [Chloroflexi bacterium]|nr:aldo/keto reductase [Chloroflexota bacterium]